MQELRANTQVKVVIGPVVAVGDGFTPVTTLDLSTADEAELMKHDAAAVTSISAATFAAITSADGYYNLTLTTSHTDTEGMLTVLVNDDSLCLPVKQCFMVLAEAAWDSKYVAKDDGFMDVNIKTIGRADTQETEANNLETACANYSSTRGLTGTALPAAAADAAGGLPISDAGGLDLDAKLANTNEVTAARMGALTDWIDGGRLDLLLDATLADTNELQTDWTNGGRLDLIIDATLADTNELQTDWANGGRLDLILDARASQTSVDAIYNAVVSDSGTVNDAGASTTTFITTLTSLSGFYDDLLIKFTSGNLVGQCKPILSIVTNGTIVVSEAFTAAPDNGSAFDILSVHIHPVSAIADGVWDEPTIGHVTAGTFGEQVKTDVDMILALATTAQADLDIITGTAGALIDTGTGPGQLSINSGLLAWNPAWDAEVQSEVDDGLIAKGLDHLVFASVAGADVADNSIVAKMVSSSATADWDSFVNTSDALQALRDRGDTAWITATGFSTLTAGDVRTAIGLATANLDTQLATHLSQLTYITTDAQPEPTGVPSATATPMLKLAWLFKALIRELTVTSSAKTFKNAAGDAEWKKVLSDDGTTYTEETAEAP